MSAGNLDTATAEREPEERKCLLGNTKEKGASEMGTRRKRGRSDAQQECGRRVENVPAGLRFLAVENVTLMQISDHRGSETRG